MISVLILTQNEERDLAGCIESVGWCDDVHVFDSFSTDRTTEIARLKGAHVIQRRFDDWASQRAAAIRECPFRHDWVLIVDADERIPSALVEECRARLLQVNPQTSAFRMRRKDYFLGTWIKHSQMSPYFIRLLRPEKTDYHRSVNEVTLIDGEIEELSGTFDHYPFSKGTRQWLERHNSYSSMEAEEVLIARAKGTRRYSIKTALFGQDFNERRFHQKGLFYNLPCRPLIKFAYLIFFRRAFLDGRAGITYAILQTIYEYLIVLKTRELQGRGRTVSLAERSDPIQVSVQNTPVVSGSGGPFP